MSKKQFFLLSAFLVFLVLASAVTFYRQVSYAVVNFNEPPLYNQLFSKILSNRGGEFIYDEELGDIVELVDGEKKFISGRLLKTQKINDFSWNDLVNDVEREGKIIEWADLDMEAKNCQSAIISEIGITTVCQGMLSLKEAVGVKAGAVAAVLCPDGSVFFDGTCYDAVEVFTCARGEKAERKGEKLYCRSGSETIRCASGYREKLQDAELGGTSGVCLGKKTKEATPERIIKCSTGKKIYKVSTSKKYIRCQKEAVKVCPYLYSVDGVLSTATELHCKLATVT